LISIGLYAQEEVKLKDGKTIILYPNGTWKYKNDVPNNNTFTDTRDGHVYKTVTIGTQIWMAENFAYKTPKGCWANKNDKLNVVKYGYLYNLEIAKTVCPKGWHLPSESEWTTLINYLGCGEIAGGKLTSTEGWGSLSDGVTNNSGFSALPSGSRYAEGGPFAFAGELGYWWTSSMDGSTGDALGIFLNNSASVSILNHNIGEGLSVRCIKN
jgi:uncharacterized protein (TIGR02145 family)